MRKKEITAVKFFRQKTTSLAFTATKATFDGEKISEANTSIPKFTLSSIRKNLNKKRFCGCCSAANKKDDSFNNNKPSFK